MQYLFQSGTSPTMLHFKDQPGWTHVFGPNYPLTKLKPHKLSRKPLHQNKNLWRKIQNGLKKLLWEFFSDSTIHGLRNIGSSGKSSWERFWWLIVVVVSVTCCGMLIRKVFHKWENNPVIVSFDDKPVMVWNVPFPAITICPEAKIRMEVMNFTADFYKLFHSNETMDQASQDRLMAVLQICDDFFHMFEPYQEKYPNRSLDIISLLQQVSVQIVQTILLCKKGEDSCKHEFSHTLTEDGICFTYNGFSSYDMFNEGVLHSEYKYMTETKNASNWTLENGYAPGTPFLTHPYRASGYATRLKMNVASSKTNIEAHCAEEQGFRVVFHSPDEYPLPFAKYILLSLDRDINVAVRPQLLTTSKELAAYPPERRHCYFSHERTLKFFRVYNQNNCELECLTNYTLARCGCVKFSMPRSEGTRVCSTAEQKCIMEAHHRMLRIFSQKRLKGKIQMSVCNCMAACSSIQYLTEVTQTTYDTIQTLTLRLKPWVPQMLKVLDDVTTSKVTVYFKGAEFLSTRRSELFGLADFVANCGGILGLCLGISFVSLAELLYYCLVRPMLAVKKSVRRGRKVVTVESFKERY